MRARQMSDGLARSLPWLSIAALGGLALSVPFLISGAGAWLQIDWIDGRKVISIDDAYRYFAARHALQIPTIFLWNYVMPGALLVDTLFAAATAGNLLAMRLCHAGIGIVTLLILAHAGRRAGCHPMLVLASLLIVGLMPLYLVVSSSFYAEGLLALLLAGAFVCLIEGRYSLLAVIIGLAPLVRPEGALYCATFTVFFASRRDFKRCAVIVLPGLIYLTLVVAIAGDVATPFAWRLALREILSPVVGQISDQTIRLGRLPNLLWASLALAALLIRDYRRWWPILIGPWLLIAMQAVTISRGLQDYELRYLYSIIPVFAIAWALPIRCLLQRSASAPLRRNLVIAATAVVVFTTVAGHLAQFDWVRQHFDRSAAAADVARHGGPALLAGIKRFDPGPARAFARRVDDYIDAHPDIKTVFIAESLPLYFLDFPTRKRGLDPVLIPHNATAAAHSGGYFFGYSLTRLRYRYFKFKPIARGDPAAALLVLMASGTSPFTGGPEHDSGAAPNASIRRRPVAALQSGALQAFPVAFEERNVATWTFATP